jgi:hypothetical protein
MTIFYILGDNYSYESRFLSNFSFASSISKFTIQNYLFTTLKSIYFFPSLLLCIPALCLKFAACNFQVASYLSTFLFSLVLVKEPNWTEFLLFSWFTAYAYNGCYHFFNLYYHHPAYESISLNFENSSAKTKRKVHSFSKTVYYR